MLFPWIELAASIYFGAAATILNTEDRRSAILFKFLPGIFGVVLALDAFSRMGWV